MKKFEKFVSSHLHLLLLSLGAFGGWYLDKSFTLLNVVMTFNELVLLLYLVWASVILILVKDSKHVIFIYISALLMLNTKDLSTEHVNNVNIIYVMVGVFVTGILLNIFRFTHKFKWGYISIGFTLMAISYFLPLIYEEIEPTTLFLAISSIGIAYLLIYWFFGSTSNLKVDDLLKYLFYMSITLMLQMYFVFITYYISLGDISLFEKIASGLSNSWGKENFGYGNINDVVIFFTVAFAGQIYYIYKRPKCILLWIFPLLSIAAVFLSASRGGWISWGILLFIIYIFFLTQGTKLQIVVINLFVVAVALPFVIKPELFELAVDIFKQGGYLDIDTFSSWRFDLYKDALKIFREFPYFGGGWVYQFETANPDRIQIFHSTIFHTLAISGLFGLFSLIVYIVSSIVLFIKKMNINVAILVFSWIATMVHGIFDNTVHMIIYTILSIFILVSVENEETNSKYLNESLDLDGKTFNYLLEPDLN